jgi:uncharacterized repeat protein (TIGR01451 family)
MRRFLAALALALSIPASASTYTVDDTGDAPDFNPGDDVCLTAPVNGVCTLRAAIMEANAHAGPDAIEFDVAGTIFPATQYPAIVDTVTIEGRSAPGYTNAPVVKLDGAFSVEVGLHFDLGSDESELIALEISGFSITAVLVDSDTLSIRKNYLGPVTGGTPNTDGLQLNGNGSTVGGADDGGNVISGNDFYGILVTGTNHVISDNYIGVDETGAAALMNGEDGISIDGGATGVRIGSDTEGEENVISGNFDVGVSIDDGTGNIVAGNFIGLDDTGTVAIPNFIGVEVNASGNTIGTADAGNVISGNDDDGIDINADDTIVHHNIIGLDATGTDGVGNAGFGVAAFVVLNAEIGGTDPAEWNVISFNGAEGIFFLQSDDSSIVNNFIGLDLSGTNIRGNGLEGILLIESFDNTISSNIVSGNSLGGIVDAGGIGNIIESNLVGTTGDGVGAAGNIGTGVELFGTLDSIVRSNVVSANDGHGIETTFGSTGALIHSNIVGLGSDLTTELGNLGDGVNVCDSASDTVVGSVDLGGNTITGSGANGIGVEPTALQNNTWAANSIYDNELLGIDLEQDGVTPNDEDDPDEGANHLQNYPELGTAVTNADESQVRGTINTLPSTDFTLHFYSSPTADPSGFGEGQTYLGTLSGTTDAGGDATFVFDGPPVTVGHVVTATATTADGTSEFSAAETVQAAPSISFSSATYSAGEADGTATITVTRSGNLDVVSTIDFSTQNDSAAAGSDYTGTTGTLTFLSGDDTETFTVTILNDTLDENAEHVLVMLSNPGGAELVEPFIAALTITDDDNPPSITIDDPSDNEGDVVVFTVSLSAASSFDITVEYDTVNGTATAASDYTAQSNTATILAGNTSTTIGVPTTEDAVFEGDETFTVELSNSTNASIGDDEGTGTIVEDEAEPTISIDDASEPEGTQLIFTISLSGPRDEDYIVNYVPANGTATDGSDYLADPDFVIITAGTTSTSILVPSIEDAIFEGDETFFINVTGNDNFADNQGLGTIEEDDAPPSITVDDASRTEGTNIIFTVTLSTAAGVDVTFDYDTANDSATAGSDYTAQSNSGTITAGNLSTTITVPTSADALFELDETFFVNLSGASNATIADNQGLGTIENDDAMPSITIDDVSLAEGSNLQFTVTLSTVAGVDVTFNHDTADDTADAGSDYTAQSDGGTITAGTLTTTITVPSIEDAVFEDDETFFVNLSGASNATIDDGQGLGTIENDEGVPTITIDDPSESEGEDLVFTITLSEAAGVDVTVDYDTADGSAAAGSDYTAQSDTATITAGSTSTTVTVPSTEDAISEGDETFVVNLSGATNAAIDDNQGTGTIEDDEPVPSVSISDESEPEGTDLVFTVTLSNTSDADMVIAYETVNDSAFATDYTAESGSVVIPAGSLTATITIATTADDLFEHDETFVVQLSGGMGFTISDGQGVGTIENDDAMPSVSIDDVSGPEENNLEFTVSLSAVAGVDITVDYETADGTATAGSDYEAESGTLVIPAGSPSETIGVSVIGNAEVEPDETLFVNLTGATNAFIADDQGIGTIENDDPEIGSADLSISKTTNATTFTPGQEITYTITVGNAGPLTATGITVEDELPSGASLVSASGDDAVCSGTATVTCTIAALAAGESTTITLVVVATGTLSISNTATVDAAAPPDAFVGNNTATAVISPAAVAGAGIPTLSEWAMLLMALALAGLAMRRT